MNPLKQAWAKYAGFIQQNVVAIVSWPLICALLAIFVWNTSITNIEEKKHQLDSSALQNVTSLSRAYEQYLTRTLEQIDQISMHVKYDWEKTHGNLRLEDLRAEGVFTASQFALVAVIDATGHIRSATTHKTNWEDAVLRQQFRFHQNNISSAMQIGFPSLAGNDNGNGSSNPVLHFTRRLDKVDDGFDGMVVISVEAAYFSQFYDEQSLGKHGLLAMLSSANRVGASRLGTALHAGGEFAIRLPYDKDNGTAFVGPDSGFSDQESRFLGWQRLSAYPLTAVVGLSEQDLLASYLDTWRGARHYALLSCFALLIFAIVATILSIQLAWRKYQSQKINDTYRLATEDTGDGFYLLHAVAESKGSIVDFTYVDCNARGARLFGLSREELIGVNMTSLQDQTYFAAFLNSFKHAMETGFCEDDIEFNSERSSRIIYARRRLVRSDGGVAVTLRDISAKIENKRELERVANHDSLTGLHNRHWLLKFLPEAIQRAKTDGYMLALLFIDLDGFKSVNDTQGHAAGDQLLKSVATRLQSLLRPTDKVVRLGGDEFVVTLEPVDSTEKPALIAERITDAFKQAFQWAGDQHQIGASIGISLYPHDGADTETLLKNADIAMYSVKADGKGHYNFYKPELYRKIKARFEIEQALIQAIALDQFILHYQARVNTLTGELTSMEALLRWIHPERGMISPAEFIPIAEENGLIVPLGDLVIEKACAQMAEWRSQRLPPIPVSINASARQFHAGNLKEKLLACMEKYAIPSRQLEVEITESAMLGEDNAIAAELSAMRAMGIELLVDDFGTGYSSLSQLQRLDMDVLKVDRVFTNELGKSRGGEIFFNAIVSMAHALDMRVVAEGVETQAQLDILRTLCCDEVQGYFISRPLPPEQMPALMRKRLLLTDNLDLFALAAPVNG